MPERSLIYRILQFPLTRIIAGLTILSIVLYFCSEILDNLPRSSIYDANPENLIYSIAISAITIAVYYFLFRSYEHRSITELSLNGLGKNLALGMALGAGLQLMVALVMAMAGDYEVLAVNGFLSTLPGFSIGIMSGITEEIMFRGIIFRITEEKLGSVIALIISSLLFGFIHLSNPGASVSTAINVAIEGGLVLGAAYIFTRNLWLPITLHFSWNWMQGGILGLPISGYVLDRTLISAKTNGSVLLTGGSFGPEASVQTLVFGIVIAAVLLYMSSKQNKWIPPFWKNRPAVT